MGQWLLGADYGHVALVRVKIDRSAVISAAIMRLQRRPKPSPSQEGGQKPIEESIMPWLRASFRIEEYRR